MQKWTQGVDAMHHGVEVSRLDAMDHGAEVLDAANVASDVDLTWQGARRRAPCYKSADALRYPWTQFIFSSPLSALSLQKPSTNLDSIFRPSKV